MVDIQRANPKHLPLIVPLFDAYRVFYQQPSDLHASRKFLSQRLQRNESVLFLAMQGESAIGFTQLYPLFSSVSMAPVYLLNDLFVLDSQRGKGVGECLLKHAKVFCTSVGFKGLALETAIDNPAQKLYERLGWQKDVHCFHYFWTAQ
jgi:GNAT superfamily N-acetyltransferase